MDIEIHNKQNHKANIPKTCWNIKSLDNNKDAPFNSIIVPTSDNRQNSPDFPSLKEASSKLNKKNESKTKVTPPFLKNQSRKSLSHDIQILQINNLHIDYQEYCSPIKKEFKLSIKTPIEPYNKEERDGDLNKALVPYSPFANYQSMFLPPPYSQLYQYWWKIPKCGFELINGNYSNDPNEQLKRLTNIINDKDTSLINNYSKEEIQNTVNMIKTLNLKMFDMTQNNYDASLYVNYRTLSKIKIKDINPPNTTNRGRRKSKLVKLESVIIKNEQKDENTQIIHLEDIFKVFQGIKVTNGPSGKYTLLMHLLFFLTPRELCLMTRVCKSWRKELLDSKYSTDLWWNIWMNHVWIGKAQKEKVDYDKYLEHSRSYNELSSLANSSRESLNTSMSSLYLNNEGISTIDLSKMNKKLKYPWYRIITRAERKRGTKVWFEKAVEEYRKTEVRGLEIISNSSSDEESSSESDEDSPKYQRPASRGKLTAEEKNESRSQYKLMGSKPKHKRPWTREKGLSKEWLLNNDSF